MAGDLGSYLHLQRELYHGSQSYKSVFQYLLKKQSILQLLKLEKRYYG